LKLFAKSEENVTKCKKCGLDLHDAERLKRHEKIAHGRKIREKCRNCGVEFMNEEELRKHKKKCKN
tara:strand:- start:1949 stop:2146 length:198 start_codon:yes stop_codon:yes gene_type:complete